jgi:Tol biopolymer transport system component
VSVTIGTRIGPYEIVDALGAGGMGEVYRARDTKLNRDVAIKVLLPAVANDPDRLARFSREAQVLASLNHPNIAAIYGIEETSGVTALVMELVEGEDLSQRIARGAIPIDEALPIARQIAEALEVAHECGIIHRDLKPANITVRADGTVKVLDFGLAKAINPNGGSNVSAMNSPTLSLHATEAGIILGTAAYMSPEQAKGKAVDRRADIWAFGAVLFEMLTGKRAFAGDDMSDTLVSVLRDDPDWFALPADASSGVTQAIRLCLRKDPKQRVRDISAVRLAMDGEFESAVLRGRVRPPASPKRHWVIAASAAIGAVIAALVAWRVMKPAPTPPAEISRFAIVPPASQALASTGDYRNVAIAPDGSRIAYVARIGNGNSNQIAVRRLDHLDATLLGSAGIVRDPFFSPDGQWIGFFTSTELQKISVDGGPVVTIFKLGSPSWGGSWADDNTIVFGTASPLTGLVRVPAGGGEATVLTTRNLQDGESDHGLPSMLPGGRAVLFTISRGSRSALEGRDVAVLDLATGQRKILIRGGSDASYTDAIVTPDDRDGLGSSGSNQRGYLVYAAQGTLRAVRFDLTRLEVIGDAIPVVDHVTVSDTGTAGFAIARNGTLMFAPGDVSQIPRRQLVWVDRNGVEDLIDVPARAYVIPRLSPDGSKVALDIRDQEGDIWTFDLARPTLTRLTFDPGLDIQPVWTADSRRILFASRRGGAQNIFWHAADGTGKDERITSSADAGQYPSAVTPDGTRLIAHQMNKTNFDIVQFALPLPGVSAATEAGENLVQTDFAEFAADISPNGRFVAYHSDESGRMEVYVRPYPKTGDGRWQVSTGGGTRPLWGKNGRELFYIDAAGALTAVPLQAPGETFAAGVPAALFLGSRYAVLANVRNYDVTADGRRFLMIKEAPSNGDATPASLVVVLNWFDELKRLVPGK